MELLPLVCVSLLTWSGTTFAAENEPKVIRVDKGRDVILPCSLNTKKNITSEKFEWKKDGRQVFLYDDGNHSNNNNTGQDQQFKDRVSNFPDKQKSGDASIIIRNMKVADSGVYTCEFTNLQPRQIFYIKLFVEPKVIRVDKGRDVILPCSLSTKKNITSEKFEWRKDDRQVFLYDDGNHSNIVNTSQDVQFKDRVSHFPDELMSGDASIIIRDMKVADSGVYTCEFTNLQPRQIFYIKLFVEPKVIRVDKGRDVILPCSLSTKENITSEKFEWRKDDRQVFLYDDGNHSNIVNTSQDVQFKDRVSHFPDELMSGDASIIIRDMKVADSGVYTCEFTNLQPRQIFYIKLFVEPKVIRVDKGRDVILPCSLSTKENITSEKFEWRKDDRQVFLYDDGNHSNIVNTSQDVQFKDRVSHFPDELMSGDASIIIRDMKVADSGDYTCEFPRLQPRKIFYMKLVVETKVLTVAEGRDVILPCSLSTKENITREKFEWKKDGRQVFLYDDGDHSNIVNTGQDQQFKDRVSHFPDELMSGDASITIRNMKVADSGEYTCNFTNLQSEQIFYIKLVVFGALPKPYVRILDLTKDGMLLQCEVQGAFPKPELHWKDSDGNILPAEEIQETGRGGRYLQTTVTKTDNYRCVATQKEINHQTHYETFVYIPDASPKPSVRILDLTKDGMLLQCEVRGAFPKPKPKLLWQDRAGNILPAEEPLESETGELYYNIILQTTVTKTDKYRCVATQKETNRQTYADTFVYIPGKNIALILAVTVLAVVLALLCACILYKKYQKGRSEEDEVVYMYTTNGEATS
ncbi:CD276 antigen-like isoform X9 [Scomber scombrus]